MNKWIAFLSDPSNHAVLSMLARQPSRVGKDGSPYQVPMLMKDPTKIMAVVIGNVVGSHGDGFVVVDPSGTLAWKTFSKRILKVIDENSPRCVFVICGTNGDAVFPAVDSRHVIVRLSCNELSTEDAEAIISAAASV